MLEEASAGFYSESAGTFEEEDGSDETDSLLNAQGSTQAVFDLDLHLARLLYSYQMAARQAALSAISEQSVKELLDEDS